MMGTETTEISLALLEEMQKTLLTVAMGMMTSPVLVGETLEILSNKVTTTAISPALGRREISLTEARKPVISPAARLRGTREMLARGPAEAARAARAPGGGPGGSCPPPWWRCR